MTHTFFRYIIKRPDTNEYLGKRNKWGIQLYATDYQSRKTAEKKCSKLGIDRLEILRVHYRKDVVEPHLTYRHGTFTMDFMTKHMDWQTKYVFAPTYSSLLNQVF